ncbi:PREDICTED: zinc finger MYM-type protein 1-like [Prunus mume]|uniref:Zinc finger MYM-type protein 1-like n=1 Tax=Prunus mume TaxID=102107 RepID=A0ABM0P0Q0_PRUMU|nr:PREDICTED: zinc finger MYM-type protein 1-like [Prunus mume]
MAQTIHSGTGSAESLRTGPKETFDVIAECMVLFIPGIVACDGRKANLLAYLLEKIESDGFHEIFSIPAKDGLTVRSMGSNIHMDSMNVSSDSVGSSRTSNSKQSEVDEVLANLQADPGLRIRMIEYDTNIRDEVQRAYLQKGSCQPRGHSFPQSNISGINRRFIPQWFDEFDWLEYSVSKDAAFCLYCYLFKSNFEQVGSEAFTGAGFKNWKKGRERMKVHVEPVGSVHNKAREAATNLMNQNTHIETAVSKHSEQACVAYRRCLIASIKCIKFLLRQGLSFRENDESATSSNRGNYLELLQFLADNDEKVKEVVLENAPGNLKLVAPKIQKDIVNACAGETLDVIMSGLKDRFFSILLDEARDISMKEQMAMVLRYVDDKGHVIERFVGVQHVTDTTSTSLKDAIDIFFSSNGLSFSKLLGQGYDGASHMRGELNGLKTKILREQPCAYYGHCFAHQLQLALVAVAKKNIDIASFFTTTNSVVNHVRASCKRRDALRAPLQEELVIAFENYCLITGRAILGLTNDVSQALQKKDQEIVNAMALVKSCKEKLHWMRNNGFDALVEEVSSFCDKHHIDVPNMDETFILPGRSRRNAPIKTNRHHYSVELFIYVIDEQLKELDDRFNEVNTKLLICLACLSPNDSFVAFDKQKLLRLAQFYPQDFSDEDLLALEDQLELYIHYVCSSSDFSNLQGIVLPVTTASVKKAFSVMNIIKGPLRNKMGDQWLSDSLLVYVEKDVFDCIENEAIMLRFQSMKPRRGQL